MADSDYPHTQHPTPPPGRSSLDRTFVHTHVHCLARLRTPARTHFFAGARARVCLSRVARVCALVFVTCVVCACVRVCVCVCVAAACLAYALYLLSQHPEWEERIVAEVRQLLEVDPNAPVLSDRLRSATMEDLARLPVTEAVVKETLRL